MKWVRCLRGVHCIYLNLWWPPNWDRAILERNIFQYFRTFVDSHLLHPVTLLGCHKLSLLVPSSAFEMQHYLTPRSPYYGQFHRHGRKKRSWARQSAQRGRLGRCWGKTTMQEIAAGSGEKRLSVGGERRGKTHGHVRDNSRRMWETKQRKEH